MTDFEHDPNSLADRLDQVLPPGEAHQIGSSDDPLISAAVRLASAPRPTLTPASMARIYAKIEASPPAPTPFWTPAKLALVASLAVVVIAGAVFGAGQISMMLNAPTPTVVIFPSDTPTPTITQSSTPTTPPTETLALPPTQTPPPQVVATVPPMTPTIPATIAPTQEQGVLPTVSPVPTDMPTQTDAPTSTVVPTAVPTSLPITLVVEGPVQWINGNIIVIYDLEIVLDPADPILSLIQIGDVVRVDGSLTTIASQVTVTAVNAAIVSVSPQGEIWRDPGDCSNPPPPWAPAHGWRQRCTGAPSSGNSGNSGNPGNSGNQGDRGRRGSSGRGRGS